MTKKTFSYARFEQHIDLPKLGFEGQEAFNNARVLIVGCGGLGAPAAMYLTAAGIGQITIIDDDHVSLSNLQRQILFSNDDVDVPKVEVAQKKLKQRSDRQNIDIICSKLNSDNATDLISKHDIVLDATDDHRARYFINKACLRLSKPWVFGSVFHYSGQMMFFDFTKKESACFQCLFHNLSEEDDLPNCKSAGVLSPVPGNIATLQAIEVLKFIAPDLENNVNTLLNIDFESLFFHNTNVEKLVTCPVCS